MNKYVKMIRLGFRRARSHDDYAAWQRFMAEMTTEEMEQRGLSIAELDVMEIGAFKGGYSQILSEKSKSFLATDVQKDHAFEDLDIPFATVDALKPFPLEDQSFDLIYCSSVIEHLSDPDNLLKESFRVLRPGGTLFLSYPPFYSLFMVGGHYFKPFHLLGEKLAVKLAKWRFRRIRWIQDVTGYADCYGSFGLYPLKVDQVDDMLLEHGYELRDTYTRSFPINTAKWPGFLKDLATWHVCYLARKV